MSLVQVAEEWGVLWFQQLSVDVNLHCLNIPIETLPLDAIPRKDREAQRQDAVEDYEDHKNDHWSVGE